MDYSSPVFPVRLQCYLSEPPHILAVGLMEAQNAPVVFAGSTTDWMLVGLMAWVPQ